MSSKGFTYTPFIFLAVMLIVITFTIYASSADARFTSDTIASGAIDRATFMLESQLTQMSSTALETMATNYKINGKAAMESTIQNNIKAKLNIDANISILNDTTRTTRVAFAFNNFSIVHRGATISAAGDSFETILNYPFAKYNEIYLNFVLTDICGRCDAQTFQTYLSGKWGLDWIITFITGPNFDNNGKCTGGIYEAKIYDSKNLLTNSGYDPINGVTNEFWLENKAKPGNYSFTFVCP